MKMWLNLPLVLLLACADDAQPAQSTRRSDVRSESSHTDQGGVDVVESAPPRSAKQTAGSSSSKKAATADAGQAKQKTESTKRAAGGSGGMSKAPEQAQARDAASDSDNAEMEAAKPSQADASMGSQGATDAGSDGAPERPKNSGSCCETSTQPGCGDAALRACVCEREPRCCSDAWDDNCTRLVKEKHCQRGVRDCVCGFGEGQWQQAYCCQGGWNDTCESVAYNKCGATSDCP